MSEPAYGDLAREELILRDHLAIYRTVLANERTLLSYIRTALATGILGASLVGLMENPGLRLLGVVAVGAGIAVLGIGLWRFRTMHRRIAASKDMAMPLQPRP